MSLETLKIGEGIYTISDLSEILNVPKSKARYWFNKYVREILPSITGFRYNFEVEKGLYINFKSLLQFYVFIQLKDKEHKTKHILEMYKFLSKKYNTNYPFATKEVLSVGSEILIDWKNNLLSTNLQYSMSSILEEYIEKIEFDNSGNALRFFPLGFDKSVVVDPKVQFGSPVINGTRINVSTIIDALNSGDSKKLISSLYSISESQINDVIEYSNAA